MTRLSRRAVLRAAGVAGLGLIAGCGRLPWQAAARVPRIGLLGQASAGSASSREAFFQSLHESGYVDGQNILIESRPEPDMAPELAALPVNVIVADGARAALAAKHATTSIPIILGFSSIDPVAEGLVSSLARPGGNITGVTANVQGAQFGAKRLELLRDALPRLTRLGVLWDAGDPATTARWGELQAVGESLGIETLSLVVRAADEVAAALDAAASAHLDALIVLHNTLTQSRRAMITDHVASSRLPAMYEFREWASGGGLMSYGPSAAAMWHRAGQYVDKVLKGASPADLPVEQPRQFQFVINLQTAQALGLTIPQHVLLQATEIIQ